MNPMVELCPNNLEPGFFDMIAVRARVVETFGFEHPEQGRGTRSGGRMYVADILDLLVTRCHPY